MGTRRAGWKRHAQAGSALILAAGLAAGLAGCSSEWTAGKDDSGNQGDTFSFYSPGGQLVIHYPRDERKPVKNFSGPSVRDESQTISLSDFDGKVVVLNAWGQWCAPCRAESDDLQTVHEAIESRGGTVLGINVRDFNPAISRDFLEDNGLTFPSISDPPFRSAAALGGVPSSVVPSTIVLDRQHRPAVVFLRGITDKELLEAVNEVLAEPEDAS